MKSTDKEREREGRRERGRGREKERDSETTEVRQLKKERVSGLFVTEREEQRDREKHGK